MDDPNNGRSIVGADIIISGIGEATVLNFEKVGVLGGRSKHVVKVKNGKVMKLLLHRMKSGKPNGGVLFEMANAAPRGQSSPRMKLSEVQSTIAKRRPSQEANSMTAFLAEDTTAAATSGAAGQSPRVPVQPTTMAAAESSDFRKSSTSFFSKFTKAAGLTDDASSSFQAETPTSKEIAGAVKLAMKETNSLLTNLSNKVNHLEKKVAEATTGGAFQGSDGRTRAGTLGTPDGRGGGPSGRWQRAMSSVRASTLAKKQGGAGDVGGEGLDPLLIGDLVTIQVAEAAGSGAFLIGDSVLARVGALVRVEEVMHRDPLQYSDLVFRVVPMLTYRQSHEL